MKKYYLDGNGEGEPPQDEPFSITPDTSPLGETNPSAPPGEGTDGSQQSGSLGYLGNDVAGERVVIPPPPVNPKSN